MTIAFTRCSCVQMTRFFLENRCPSSVAEHLRAADKELATLGILVSGFTKLIKKQQMQIVDLKGKVRGAWTII